MLTLPSSTRILLHREPVDFRKAHDGLAAIVRAELKEDPLSGDLFVFLNRGRNKVKLLHWDGNGLWLHYKRLEKGTFRAIAHSAQSGVAISRAELSMLLDGIEVKKGKISRRFAEQLRLERRKSDEKEEHHEEHVNHRDVDSRDRGTAP
jgi:transposase